MISFLKIRKKLDAISVFTDTMAHKKAQEVIRMEKSTNLDCWCVSGRKEMV